MNHAAAVAAACICFNKWEKNDVLRSYFRPTFALVFFHWILMLGMSLFQSKLYGKIICNIDQREKSSYVLAEMDK